MELSLLKAASNAANTPARLGMLEGLLEGDERQISRTLEEHPEHAELLDDDFFWCYMGLGMMMGSRDFWRAIGDWGYSLNSTVLPPEPSDESRALTSKGVEMTLAQWGIRFLPLDRLQWLEDGGLLNLWEQSIVALNGMLYNDKSVSDWIQSSWKKEISKGTQEWSRRLPPFELVQIGKIASLLRDPEYQDAMPGMRSAEEIQNRYESFCMLYLEIKHPGTMSHNERKKKFLSDLPPARKGERELSQWLVGKSPEIFSSSWMVDVLSSKQESWEWAKALWWAGAPSGGAGTPAILLSKSREIMTERRGDAADLVEGALRQWMTSASEEEKLELLEGNSHPSKSQSPLWQLIEEGHWGLASVWISLGARLDQKNKEGLSVGAKILSLHMSNGDSDALKAWDSYRARAMTDDPFHPPNELLCVEGKDLKWFTQDDEGQALVVDAIMNGTFPVREARPFRGRL